MENLRTRGFRVPSGLVFTYRDRRQARELVCCLRLDPTYAPPLPLPHFSSNGLVKVGLAPDVSLKHRLS